MQIYINCLPPKNLMRIDGFDPAEDKEIDKELEKA